MESYEEAVASLEEFLADESMIEPRGWVRTTYGAVNGFRRKWKPDDTEEFEAP